MSDDQLEEIKSLYRQYLLSTSKYDRKVCDTCGWLYSHPLNYCVKCPGRIVSVKPLILGEIEKNLQQQKMFTPFIAGFAEYYKDKTNLTFPFKEFEYPSRNYYELTNVLRALLGKEPVNLEG